MHLELLSSIYKTPTPPSHLTFFSPSAHTSTVVSVLINPLIYLPHIRFIKQQPQTKTIKMPSFFRTAALAAFAATASALVSNTTAPSASTVSGWEYVGCAISNAYTGSLIESSPLYMTVERCLLDCSAYQFARIHGADCFCASSTNGTTPVADAACNEPCPGNSAEACGGSVAASRRRQAAGTVISVYEKAAVVPAGDIYITVITNVYIDYSPVLQALTTVTYLSTVTLTGCGCTNPSTPTVPVTTTVYGCTLSGTSTVATLTVPSGVTCGTLTAGQSTVTVTATGSGSTSSACPGCASSVIAGVTTTAVAATPTATKAPVYTGAAAAHKAAGGLIAGAVAVAALL